MSERVDGRRLRYQHRRAELLAAVGDHVLDHGLHDLTLRSAAAAVGVSHATLIHHFATFDQLVGELVDVVLTRGLLPSPDEVGRSGYDLAAAWAYLRTGEGARYARLYLSVTGSMMHGEPSWADAVRRSLRTRVTAIAAGMVRLGCPPEEAEAYATTVLARFRGLATDLFLTGDAQRLDAAFEIMLDDARRRVESWTGNDPQPPPTRVTS